MERRLGQVIDCFQIVKEKYRHNWSEVQGVYANVLALDNMKTFPELVGSEIYQMDHDAWLDFIEECGNFLDENTIVDIQNEVFSMSYHFCYSHLEHTEN